MEISTFQKRIVSVETFCGNMVYFFCLFKGSFLGHLTFQFLSFFITLETCTPVWFITLFVLSCAEQNLEWICFEVRLRWFISESAYIYSHFLISTTLFIAVFPLAWCQFYNCTKVFFVLSKVIHILVRALKKFLLVLFRHFFDGW